MFETPAIDIQELRSVLTDAGHTAAGFAALAAKKANDLRLDVTERYEEQLADVRKQIAASPVLSPVLTPMMNNALFNRYEDQMTDFRKQALTVFNRVEDQMTDLRKQALTGFNRVEAARSDLEARIEPIVAKVVDRLPEPAQKLVNEASEAAKSMQSKAHDFVVEALTVDAPKPAAKKPAAPKTTVAAAKKKASATANTAKTAKTAKTSAKAKPAARTAKPARTAARKSTSATVKKSTVKTA